MTLDVIIPTYNRSALLKTALESLLRAPVPPGLDLRILVVDNNSGDDTAAVVHGIAKGATLPIHYLLEPAQGSSQARNAGVRSGTSDLVGFIDDDEEIEPDWYNVIWREFQDPSLDFLGGPCLPNWQAPAPDWLPPGYHSAIGAIPPKPRGRYDDTHPGILNGGNAVVRRRVYEQIGLYAEHLGRGAKGLLSEEDAEFFLRMRKAGMNGLYAPDLTILHYIPKSRLTRKYHRRWAYGRAISQGVLDRESPESVTYLFGVPRHRIGRAVHGLLRLPLHILSNKSRAQAFADELAAWDLFGFVYGRFFFRRGNSARSEK